MRNVKSFRDNFEDMIFKNIEGMDIKLFKTDELCEIDNETSDLYKMIKNLLPKEYKGLIADYEEMRNKQQGISDNIIYEQGLKDGAKLTNILFN